jgi:hypothetical protein
MPGSTYRLECSSVCVVDATGRIVRETKVASESEALIPDALPPHFVLSGPL